MSLLRTAALSMRFGGLVAVGSLDMEISKGEILGLIGPNGSGKSTVVNLISGILPPTGGKIFFEDKDITRLPSWRISRLGIARTFQLIRLFPSLSVVDNVILPTHPKMQNGLVASVMNSRAAREEAAEHRAQAIEVLKLFELDAFADRPAMDLSIGQQRMVELARGMYSKPKLFILDEPAAGLSPPNVDKLIVLIRRLRDEFGITILLVEHVMRVVQALCDRLVVLDYGSKIADGVPSEVAADPAVIEAYIGSGKAAKNARI